MAGPFTLEPKSCALILVDMINDFVKGQGPPYITPEYIEPVVRRFDRLVAHCRRVGTPLIYITTLRRTDNADAPRTVADITGRALGPMLPGTPATDPIDELRPQDEDYILVKPRFSAFYGTNLDGVLKTLGTDTVLVGGIATHRSVAGTARDAKNRDLQCVVVSDCCTAPQSQLDVHGLTIKQVLPLLVRVRTTDEVIAALHP